MRKQARLLLLILFLIFPGCGSQSDGDSPSFTQSPPSTKIALKGPINTRLSTTGRVYFMGELRNEGQNPACFVKITIDSKDGIGKLIDSDSIYIDGSSMLMLGIDLDTCLYPGEFASFKLISSLTSLPSSFGYKINWDTERISYPEVKQSQVAIDGPLTETKDFSGNKKILGFVKNLHPSSTVGFVKIAFTAIRDGKVIDSDYSYINGSSCTISDITIDTCLAPGESGSFEAWFDIPPSEMSGYYHKINYSVIK